MTKIAIIGSGLIGRAWATVFATHGFDVALHDQTVEIAETAHGHIKKNLDDLDRHGLIKDKKQALAHIPCAGKWSRDIGRQTRFV